MGVQQERERIQMLRHWLVRNGSKVTDEMVYVTTRDGNSLSQLDQVLDNIRKREWLIENVFVLEKATKGEYRTLKELLKIAIRRQLGV